MYNTKAWWPWATTLLVAFIGCSSDSETSGSVGGDSVKERTAAKPSEAAAFTPTTETRRILGFEDAASSDWTSDAGTLSRSATFAEGKSALSLQLTRPRGEVCSSKVSLPWKERAAVGFQLLMQEPAPASGDVRVVLRPAAPNSEPIELAPFALDDKQPGVFHQVISPLQTEGRTLDDKSQVQLCIAIDAAPGRYVLDDLRFLDTAPDETSVSDATHRLGSAPISRVGAPVGSVYGDWPGLSVSPNLTSSTGEPMQGDGVLAEPSADDTPLWSDPDAAVGKGPSDAGPPRVAMFELDDPDFCTTETLLNTAPFVSGISPLPNGTTIPYPLCTAQQYAHVIATSTLWSSNFVLMADIDLGTLSPPPTTNSLALSGVFEGNGKTLSNYTITTSGKAGVLGRLGQNGVIRNLVLSDFNVSGIARVGALVHESSGLIEHVTGVNLNVTGDESENYGVGGLVGLNYGTIADVTASVSVVAGPNAHSVGGLVGRQGNNSLNFEGFLIDSSVSGSVARSADTEARYTGGAVGFLHRGSIVNTHAAVTVASETGETGGLVGRSGGSIIGSSSSGTVICAKNSAGGLVGKNHQIIESSFSTSNVTGNESVGGLVGYAETNSNISGSSAAGQVQGVGRIGGLVGTSRGAVSTSSALGSVHGTNDVGGLVGILLSTTSSIVQSWASGSIIATGDRVGGLVGLLEGQVDASHAHGDVTGLFQVGGLAGVVELGAAVQDSSATGNTVTGDQTVGGLVGAHRGTAERCWGTAAVTANTGAGGLVAGLQGSITDSYSIGAVVALVTRAGGLVAQLGSDASVVRAYAAGSVDGPSAVGGFVGEAIGGTLEDCHFNTTENPGMNAAGNNPSVPGVVGNSGSALREQDTFTPAWDFEDVWGILDGTSYPFLRPVPTCANGGCGLGCPCPADECTDEADCTFGQVCGESNGGYFDEDPHADVCWDPHCETAERQQLCGGAGAPCGSCSGLSCEEGGCGPECPCDSGEGTCDSNSDCDPPALCIEGNGPRYGRAADVNVCEDPLCTTMATFLGCGFEGAPCGETCSGQVPCSAGCPAGTVCGVNKGHLFGDRVADVCWPEGCAEDPVETGCGTVLSACGVCECQPSCAGKTCGDDPSDGCGGFCTGLCAPREPGCTQDTDCPGGFGCLVGGGPRVGEPAGMNICLAVSCLEPDVQVPSCGTVAAECGLCPAACEPECDARECGVDPKCGTPCGSGCGTSEYCTDDGECTSSASDNDEPITVSDGNGGTRDIEPLDSPAANTVGATPGAFSVDAMGNATYAVPIAVPPGRAGLVPRLSVRYSSATGNDLLGIGWSLDGLSVISRCSRSFARDGAPGPIRYDATDVYCLDGQRLVPIAGSSTEFRTDIDTFSKIVVSEMGANGPLSFTVWTKDGRILSYGRTSNSRAFVAGFGIVRAWTLDRIEDRAGNRIDVSYKKDGVDDTWPTLEIVPLRISYGGRAGLTHDRWVQFEYETRPDADIVRGYAPAPFVKSQLLKRVDTSVKGAVTRSYLMTHEPAPNGVTRLLTLQECVPTPGDPDDPTCKPATHFGYHWESTEFTDGDGFALKQLLPGIVLDADGDGDHDLKASGLWYNGGYHELLGKWEKFSLKIGADVLLTYADKGEFAPLVNEAIDYISAENGEDEWKYIPPVLYRATGDHSNPVEMEMPGADDNTCIDEGQSLHYSAKPLRGAVDVDGNGTDEVRMLCNWRPEHECKLLDWSYELNAFFPRYTPYPEWMTDLNGDGLADHVRCEQGPDTLDGRLSFALRDPSSKELGTYTGIDVPRALCLPGCARSSAPNPVLVLDVDGDGVQNLVLFDDGWQAIGPFGTGVIAGQPATGWQALVFVGDTLTLRPVTGIPAPSLDYDLIVADVNGDGFRDVVELPNKVATHEEPIVVSLNTTRGFMTTHLESSGELAVAGPYQSWAFDYDRNGREDILHATATSEEDENGFWVWRHLAGEGNAHLESTRLAWPQTSWLSVTLDIDGDGNMDLLTPSGTALQVWYGHGNKNNLLTTVVDGAERRVDIEYTVETYEDPECVAEWPIQCLPKSPRPLVNRYTEAHAPIDLYPLGSPAPPELVHDYAYWSPRVGLGGHGWHGFSKVLKQEFRCDYDCVDDGVRTSWTELFYEPVTPVEVDGGVVYPLAGQLRESITRTLPAPSEIEDAESDNLINQERMQFTWEVATSADGRPFPYVREVYATTSASDADPDGGELVSETTTTRQVDGYGNVTLETTWSSPYNDGRATVFWPQIAIAGSSPYRNESPSGRDTANSTRYCESRTTRTMPVS